MTIYSITISRDISRSRLFIKRFFHLVWRSKKYFLVWFMGLFLLFSSELYGSSKENYVSLFYVLGKPKNPTNSDLLYFNSGQIAGNIIDSKLNFSGLIGFEFGRIVTTNKQSWLKRLRAGIEIWQMLNTTETGRFLYKREFPYDEYKYKSDLNANGIGLDLSFKFLQDKNLAAYVSYKFGLDYLSSSGGSLSPLNSSDATMLHFEDSHKFNFYYGFEVGIDYKIAKTLSLEIGYGYFDLGNYSVGHGVVSEHFFPSVNRKLVFNGLKLAISDFF